MSILLVDDDPEARKTGEVALEAHFDCYVAGSEDALMVAEHEKPHLILLDVSSAGLDGFHTLQELKQNPITAGIPVVLMSDNISMHHIANHQMLAIGIVEKPFDPSQLPDQLRQIFGHL